MTSPSKLGLALFSLTACVATRVHAAPCGRPDVELTFPPTGVSGVPPNSLLSAQYGAPARYDDEPVTLVDGAGADVALSVFYDDAEAMLHATPERELAPGEHVLTWPGLRGVSSGSVGRGRSVAFSVQAGLDTKPPSFEGLVSADWDLSRDQDPCLDGLQDRFVFELKLGDASDDLDTELLLVRLFQTKDPAEPEQSSPVPVATRAFAKGGVLELRSPAEKAGPTCYAAVVQDSIGQVSGGGDREVCVKTRQPPFFQGCAFFTPSASTGPGMGGGLIVCLLLGLRQSRRGLSVFKAARQPGR